MRSKLWFLLLISLVVLSLPAMAQERRPLGEFNVSASGFNEFSLFGRSGSGFSVGVTGNPTKWFVVYRWY